MNKYKIRILKYEDKELICTIDTWLDFIPQVGMMLRGIKLKNSIVKEVSYSFFTKSFIIKVNEIK